MSSSLPRIGRGEFRSPWQQRIPPAHGACSYTSFASSLGRLASHTTRPELQSVQGHGQSMARQSRTSPWIASRPPTIRETRKWQCQHVVWIDLIVLFSNVWHSYRYPSFSPAEKAFLASSCTSSIVSSINRRYRVLVSTL